jgi:hypothetical protein
MMLRLLKSLYGLKQAPHDWNQEIYGYLLCLGFMSFSTDRCVYVGQIMGVTCYILLYVNDMILGTPNRTFMSQLKEIIDAKFPIKNQGQSTLG